MNSPEAVSAVLSCDMRYCFGPCILDTDSFALMRDGAEVHVEPQVLDVLRVLVENAGKLVTRDALVEMVWHGRIVSDAAISSRISAARAAIGDTGTQQTWIQTVPRRGFRFVGVLETHPAPVDAPAPDATPMNEQSVRFCTAPDGTRLAYARHGSGRPLVRAPHWLTHLEQDWNSPVWRPILEAFGRDFTMWRFDQRGNGLSAEDVSDLSLDAMVSDLETVVAAAAIGPFVLYGTSQGAPVAVEYARRHPTHVTHLILHGGFARGRRRRQNPGEAQMSEALITIIREGWGRSGSAFDRSFAGVFMPDGTRAQIASLAVMQRLSLSAAMAVATRAAADDYDVSDRLAEIRVPTLVLHARDDAVHPLSEGLDLAAGIPGAEFRQLDSANHVLGPQETAWTVAFDAIRNFVGHTHEL